MSEYCIKNDSILAINDRQLDFKYKIKKVVNIDNTLIVLLDAEVRHWYDEGMFNLPNGIYGVSYQAEVLWNIEFFFRPNNKYSNSNMLSNKVIEMNPYNTYNYLYRRSLTTFTDIKKLADGSLAAYTDVGNAYVLDIAKKEIVGSFKSSVKCDSNSNIDYRIKDGSILEIAGKQLDFVFNIDKVLEVDNMLIVGIADNIKGLRNGIYAVSEGGEILWNVEEFFRPGEHQKYRTIHDYRLVLSNINNEGNVIVGDSGGMNFVLDIKNKHIINRVFNPWG